MADNWNYEGIGLEGEQVGRPKCLGKISGGFWEHCQQVEQLHDTELAE